MESYFENWKKMWNIIAINEVQYFFTERKCFRCFWLSSEPLQYDVNIRFSDYSISFHFCAKNFSEQSKKTKLWCTVYMWWNILVSCPLYVCWFKLKDSFEHNIRNKCYHLAVFSMLVTRTYVSISHAVLEIGKHFPVTSKSNYLIPSLRYTCRELW